MLILPATINDTLNLTETNTSEAINISMIEEAGHLSSKGSKSSGPHLRYETGTSKSSKSQFKFSEPQFRNETSKSKSSKSEFQLRNDTDTDIVSSGNRTSRGRESEPQFLFPAKAAKFLKEQNMFLNTTETNSSKSSRSNNDNADVTADSVVSATSGSTSAISCAWIGIAAVTGLICIL